MRVVVTVVGVVHGIAVDIVAVVDIVVVGVCVDVGISFI